MPRTPFAAPTHAPAGQAAQGGRAALMLPPGEVLPRPQALQSGPPNPGLHQVQLLAEVALLAGVLVVAGHWEHEGVAWASLPPADQLPAGQAEQPLPPNPGAHPWCRRRQATWRAGFVQFLVQRARMHAYSAA